MKRIIIIFLVLFINSSAFAGGPWTQKKGKGFYKLSEWWVVFDQHFTDEGAIDPNVTTGIFNTSLYVEHGLDDRLTGIVNANIFSRNYMNNIVSGTTGETLVEGEDLNSLGDIDLGLKYGITKPGAKIPLSASIFLGIPTGKSSGGSLGNLQTGDGEFNQMILLDVGKGFQLHEKVGAYISAYGGFNNRTNNFSDEYRYGIEAGLGLFGQRLWLTGRVYGVESLKNGETAASITSTSIFANNTEYGSLAFEISGYVTKKVGLSFSNATAFHGEIIAARPSFSAGVFLDMSK